MAKKAGTQIIESLNAAIANAGASDGTDIIMPVDEARRLVALAKRVDKRDEQNRKKRKPARAPKQATRRRARSARA